MHEVLDRDLMLLVCSIAEVCHQEVIRTVFGNKLSCVVLQRDCDAEPWHHPTSHKLTSRDETASQPLLSPSVVVSTSFVSGEHGRIASWHQDVDRCWRIDFSNVDE